MFPGKTQEMTEVYYRYVDADFIVEYFADENIWTIAAQMAYSNVGKASTLQAAIEQQQALYNAARVAMGDTEYMVGFPEFSI